MPSFQLCRSTGQKCQNWYDLAAYISEIIGGTMFGGSYVISLFKRTVVSQKTIFLLPWHYTTIFFIINSVTIFNAQIVHSHMYWGKIWLLSLADQNVHHFRKNVLNEISGKSNWNRKKGFVMGALQKLHRLTGPWSSGQRCFIWSRLIPSRSRQALRNYLLRQHICSNCKGVRLRRILSNELIEVTLVSITLLMCAFW